MTDISIIIVSWNARELLLKCLKSLDANKGVYRREIIVVDNASSDRSTSAVREKFPDVLLIQNDRNEGFARANNIGIEKAGGEYIALVNSDIEVLDNCIDKLCDYLKQQPIAGAIGPRILNSDKTLQISCRNLPSLWNIFCEAVGLNKLFSRSAFFSGEEMFFFNHNKTKTVEALSGCFLVVRREVIDQVGPMDDTFFIYSEDVDWCKRIADAGWDIVFYPEAEAIHYGGGSSSNAPIRFLIEQKRALLKYWKKHHGLSSQILIRVILTVHHLIRAIFGAVKFAIGGAQRLDGINRIKTNLSCIRFLLTQN